MKKSIILISTIIAIVLVSIGIFKYNKIVKAKEQIGNENMLLAQKLDQSRGGKFLKNLKMEKLEFEEDNLKDDLSYKVDFYLGKQKLDFKKPMKSKFNRYYFSVIDFSKKMGQTILINNDFIKFGNKTELDIHNKTYYKNGQTLKLRGSMVKEKRRLLHFL